jgi:hypothetical protein
MTMGFDEESPPTLTMHNDGKDTLLVVNGVTIAKRGHPGTAQAGTWISLEPGWTVGFNEDQSQIWARYDGVQVHSMLRSLRSRRPGRRGFTARSSPGPRQTERLYGAFYRHWRAGTFWGGTMPPIKGSWGTAVKQEKP